MTTLRAAALVLCAAGGLPAAEPTAGQWQADLAYLAKELPRHHKNLFHDLTRAEFERRVRELSSAIPKLSDLEIRAGIVRLVAAANDGHTYASLGGDRNLDLAFQEFPEGLFVIGGAKGQEEAIGARVISIDGTPAAEVRRRLSELVSAENEFARAAYVTLIHNADALRATGVARSLDGAEFVLEKAGRRFTLQAPSRSAKDPRPERAAQPFALPAHLRRTATAYWWEYLASAKTLYIQYNSCREMPSLPFQKFTDQIVEQAAREAPEKLVIDLRYNPGGNSEISNPLLQAMRSTPALRPRGGVYVLTGENTFSSGMLVALAVREEFHAMVAGEPTTERPNHYGDMRSFRLPNSGTAVYYSTKFFPQLDDDPPALMPELPVPLTAADNFAGRDPVLEAVLALPASLETNFRQAIARDSRQTRAYTALASLYKEQGRVREAETTLRGGIAANPRAPALYAALAEHLEGTKEYAEARDVLDRILKTDPTSPAALYRLGKVNFADGRYAAAEEAFRKCYRLEPDNLRGLRGAADVYARQNRVGELFVMLDDEAARNPGNREIRLYAGKLASDQGKFDVAIAEYRKAIEQAGPRAGENFELWLELSEVYRHKGDAAGAIRAFLAERDIVSDMLHSMPVSPAMVMGLLRSVCERALARQPDDPVLMHHMAFVLARSGGDLDRALALAGRASRALPAVDEAADTLGWIHLLRREPAEGLAIFRALGAKQPANAVFGDHLAMALELERALKDHATPQHIDELLRKIAN